MPRLRSEKRVETPNKTSRPQTTNSNDDKIYPGHSTFGELTKTSSYVKTLQHLRNDVPNDVRDHLDDIVQDMTRSQKKHFLKVLASLSDDQYQHILTHIAFIFDLRGLGAARDYMPRVVYFFRIGIRILAGEHPHTKVKTYAQSPRVPIAPQIKKPDVVDLPYGSPEWLEFQERLDSLPLELYDMIKELVSWNVTIYPHHDHSGVYDADKCSKEWLQGELLEMYRSIAQERSNSQGLFWDKTYVIGSGSAAATMKFITHAPVKLRMYRFKLIIGREDFYVSAAERPFGNYHGVIDEFLLFMDADRPRPGGCREAWVAKIEFLLRLKKTDMNQLDVDLTDAYSPEGTYMGEKIARCFIFQGFVPELTIHAPSIELELQILQIILKANGVDYPQKPPKVIDYASAAGEQLAPPLATLTIED